MSPESVRVRALAAGASGLAEGIWIVEHPLGTLRFDGQGAEGRARVLADSLRAEIAAGTYGARVPKGSCRLGNPCDRDRLHAAFLRDVPDELLAKVVLCDAHREAARPGSRKPAQGSPPAEAPAAPSPAPGASSGRRRKRPSPPAGGAS